MDVCPPPVVGLISVINSAGRIHDGERRGPASAVLSTFSGAASTVGFEYCASLRTMSPEVQTSL